jgi:tetratricopeptide (TPR) repeat protein
VATKEAATASEGDGLLDAELEKELVGAADDRARVAILTARARDAVAASDHSGAGSLYQRALELDPGNRELLLGLAEACRSGRRPAEAIRIYNELLTAEPRDHATRLVLAKALIGSGKARQALQQLEMLTQEPSLDRALLLDVTNWVGITHAQLGDFASAKQAWDEVLRLDPDHANAHYNQGQILEKQHRFNEAISEFQKAAGCGVSDPDYLRYLDRLGMAYRQGGHTQQALELWGKLIAVAPAGSPYAVKAQQFLARHGGSARTTRIDVATGQVVAVDASKRSTQPAMPWRRATPEGASALPATGPGEGEFLAAAERFFRQGRIEDAIRQYEQALEANPANGQTYFKLGDLYHHKKELAREKALFQLMVAQNLPAELAQAARFRLQGLEKP